MPRPDTLAAAVLGSRVAIKLSPLMNVLIVEDHDDTADALAALLTSRHHEVKVCRDPLEALACVRDFHPDVAVLDLGLPNFDGYELAQHLRVNGATCRIVVVTGVDLRDAKRCRRLGIAGYFVKPADFDTLLRSIETPQLDL